MKIFYPTLFSLCWCLTVVVCSIEDRLLQIETQLAQMKEQCQSSKQIETTQTKLVDLNDIKLDTYLDQSKWMHVGYDHSKFVVFDYRISQSQYYFVAAGSSEGVGIYYLESNKLIQRLDNSTVFDLKAISDGLGVYLAQASNSKQIKIWTNSLHTVKWSLAQTLYAHSDKVLCIEMNKDFMLTGGDDNNVVLWEFERNEFKQLRTFTGHTDWIRAIVFRGSNVISASDDKTIRVWNMNDGSLLRTLTGHTHFVYSLLLDQSTGLLYSSSFDKYIKEWNIENGRCLRNLTSHTDSVYSLLLSSDNKRIASLSHDKSIIVWNKFSGKIITTLNYPNGLYRMAVNPQNGQLMSSTNDEKIIFWSVKF